MNAYIINKKLFLFLVLFFAATGIVRAQSAGNAPGIQGRITKFSRPEARAKTNDLLGSILVERESGANGDYDKADVKITTATRIYAEKDKGKREPLKIDALRLNQRVAVRFASGPALLSYPIQVGAAEIIILSDASTNSGDSQTNVAPTNASAELKAARQAIEAGNQIWVAAWARGDAQMILDTFTPDGVELVAGGKIYKGREEIYVLMRELMRKRGGRARLTVTTTDVWLVGDTAYEIGTAVYEFVENNQPQILERRYFTVWKRQPKTGAWKIQANTGIAKQ